MLIIDDIISFSPLIMLFIDNKSINKDLETRLPQYLANSLLILIPISAVIYTYMGYHFGSIDIGRFNYNKEISMALMAPILPIIFAPYLIFFSEELSKKQMFLVHSSLIIIGLFGIITLTKSVFITAFVPYIIFYGYKALKFNSIPMLKWLFIILVLGTALFQTGIIYKSTLMVSFEGLITRSVEGYENSNFDNNRFEETENYLKQDLDLFEYLFGRGMGGAKVRNESDQYIGGIGMMHIGPSHVFIKGGILLLIILYVPLFFAISKFWNTTKYCYSLVLFYFFISNIQTSTWSFSINIFFYWYIISRYSHEVQLNKTNKNYRQIPIQLLN